MASISGAPATGLVYQATTNLPVGNHQYAFIFSDGQTTWTDPVPHSIYAGPNVGTTSAQFTTGTIIDPPHDTNPDFPFDFSDAGDSY